MKKRLFFIFSCVFILTGCQKTSSQTWENMKTAGAYFHKSFDALLGINEDSSSVDFLDPEEEGFIPLNEDDLKNIHSAGDRVFPAPNLEPGDSGCSISGFNDFKDPQGNLYSLFKNFYFETDDHILRKKEDLMTVAKIANYLKNHPKVYLNIEGHCDERASAAYNMALGLRRANHIRVLLIKQGIDFNRIYTISHGKEKPIALGHASEDWQLNRRTAFKVVER